MKKYAAILLLAILTCMLAGCSAAQPEASPTAPASEPSEAEASPTAPASEPSEAEASPTAPASEPSQAEASPTAPATEPSQAEAAPAAPAIAPPQATDAGSNILIAYFSVPETDGVDTVAGASRVVAEGEVLGNNQYIAQLIQRETGGDLFRIETVQEYPGSHDPLLEFAYNERAEDARPELATQLENLDQYTVIFLGYPNWNADLPMPLYSFLETYDFNGKTIFPFTVHGGSGFSRTIQTIQELQPNATVSTEGLSISRNSVSQAQAEVEAWVAGLNLAA